MLHRYQQARLYAGFYFADCLRPAEKLSAAGIKQGTKEIRREKTGSGENAMGIRRYTSTWPAWPKTTVKFRMLACCLVLPLHDSTGQASE
jgi:hypothetical protein